MRITILETGESYTRNPISRTLERLCLRLTTEKWTCGNVMQYILPGEDRIRLENIADTRINPLHRLPHNFYLSRTWSFQSCNETKRRGFSTTRRANDRTEFARCDTKAEIP
ncbi:hypothetical protein KDI_06780 [Dictyobacter arantiisoli]|uniref:Uncharacterized protein n=1 Tax=Dictyobacter arantiisoli TaxID=2014874 RepID=A0A5A5T834_9CHLR|nr:hypothetical protein KDI_06780 [Dictyobacter arantiisoli]